VHDVVVKQFMFAISSPDELLVPVCQLCCMKQICFYRHLSVCHSVCVSACAKTENYLQESDVVNVWNSLPDTVCFTSLAVFKKCIRTVDFSKFLMCNDV